MPLSEDVDALLQQNNLGPSIKLLAKRVEGLGTRTNVYVDGFNLYWRRLRGTPYKWLDLGKMCELLLPGTINRIRYFTAPVEDRRDDPQQSARQQPYLRALRTIPNLTIHEGQFRTDKRKLPLVHPEPCGPERVEVYRTVEKGSDANLATALLVDAFQRDYDLGVIISHDSDLKGPIEAARGVLGRRIGVVITLHSARRSVLPADTYWRMRKGLLRASQFPDTLEDEHGTITKPAGW
jgi:hypothetical protein